MDLASVGGDIKAVFSGGAFSGRYTVDTAHDGIGHVGIVVDNTPTNEATGTLGKPEGNASVAITHADGNVALALSTKAPSVFAGISGGLIHSSASEGEPPSPPTCAKAVADGVGEDGAADGAMVSASGLAEDAALPTPLEWMRPLAAALAALSDDVDVARAELRKRAE